MVVLKNEGNTYINYKYFLLYFIYKISFLYVGDSS